MKASAANFLSLIKGPRQFVIPIYQRTYSWQIAQCNKLLFDILRISNDDSVPGHFIGSVVYFQESIHTLSDVPQLLVIDGQQRLTTITLLIAAIADFIKDKQIEIDTTFTKLQNYYLFNSEEDGDLRYKLLLTRSDKDTLINVLKGVTPHGVFSQRIWENYNFFKSKINGENVLSIYNGIQRLFIVDVALEREKDNPQLIFESLNSTGLDLSQADLIRNYVLMGQPLPIQTDLYEKYWYPMEQRYGNDYASNFNWFMRDFLSVKTFQIPRIDRVYEGFKNYVQGTGKEIKPITDVVKEIFKYSNFYVSMVLLKEPDLELLQAFKNISKLRVDVSRPFLLSVYNDYSEGLLTKVEFIQIINYVENYVFRRAICGIPTNSLNKTFATLYRTFQKTNYIEGLEATFQLMDSYKRFPSDNEFEKSLITKDVYNFRSRNYLLNKLENYKRKEPVIIDEYTIEHILPQNPNLPAKWKAMLGENWKEIQETYLHTLGNLTLTGYNSELSDRSFEDKKIIEGGFNDSPIRLNEYMRKVNEWDEKHIQYRGQQLAVKASLIWKAPGLSEETLSKYKITEEKDSNVYTLESYEHLKGDMLELYYVLSKRILNIDSSVREEFKKLYIAFKSSTNFVDIVPQKARLRLSLNIEYDQIIDPLGLCKDVTDLGRWGNGDVEVGISDISEINNVMDLIQQAFDAQLELT
jgi:uncharacterized protein with ParB-like and HNH nuclease domain/predicted transport protein